MSIIITIPVDKLTTILAGAVAGFIIGNLLLWVIWKVVHSRSSKESKR